MTLTQRLMTELDQEWERLPARERAHLQDQTRLRLVELTQAEQELGANPLEAERRAVLAVSQEVALRPLFPVRLSPVWQVALIWMAVRSVCASLARVLVPYPNHASLSPLWILLNGISVVLATLVACRWHARAGARGVVIGLSVGSGLGMVVSLAQMASLSTGPAPLVPPDSAQKLVVSMLVQNGIAVVAALATLWGLTRDKKFFRRVI